MYDFYYTRLLGDVSKFTSCEGNETLDIYDEGTGDHAREVQFIRKAGTEADILNWSRISTLGTGTGIRQRMRILLCRSEEHASDAEVLSLPMASNTFEAIRVAWNFPTELLRMMLSIMPLATGFTTDISDGLMARSARSRDCSFCVALTYSRDSGTISGLLHGLRAKETATLLECLHESDDAMRDPLLLPLVLTEMRVHFFALLLQNRAQGLEDIEQSTGMVHGFSSRRDSEDAVAEKLLKISFGPLIQKLTGIAGTLAFCNMTFQSSLAGLEAAKSWRAKVMRHSETQGTAETVRWQASDEVDRRICYLESLIAGARDHAQVLEARRAAQVQTVYSLIGQRDNRLSQQIAQFSYADSQAMKAMAALSQRDSKDMRIIAWVTLVFLPGTFTATLFSSSFFDFRLGNEFSVISRWLWVYCLFTVVITVGVLAVWYYFHRGPQTETDDAERWPSSKS